MPIHPVAVLMGTAIKVAGNPVVATKAIVTTTTVVGVADIAITVAEASPITGVLAPTGRLEDVTIKAITVKVAPASLIMALLTKVLAFVENLHPINR